jgi:hypothetical protein
VVCDLCHHDAAIHVGFGDDVPVPAFGPRMVCTSCAIVGAFARPNWQERPNSESLTGRQWRVVPLAGPIPANDGRIREKPS